MRRIISASKRAPPTWMNIRTSHKVVTYNEGHHFLKMPRIMDATSGTVDKWLKREGESIKAKEGICEVTLDGLTIELNTEQDGYLAQVIKQKGDIVTVDEPIAMYVTDKENYLEFIDSEREADREAQLVEKITTDSEEAADKQKIDNKALLREIKYLINEGKIKEGSDFAKKLQSLARKGNTELISIFEASCEGNKFDQSTFDIKFFLENAEEIVKEMSTN
eukprot:gene8758-18116_t